MSRTGAVFDCDGVLVECEPISIRVPRDDLAKRRFAVLLVGVLVFSSGVPLRTKQFSKHFANTLLRRFSRNARSI